MQQSFTIDDIKAGLYQMLNQQRTSFKKIALHQDVYAERLVNELLSQNILQMDNSFNQLVQNFGGIISLIPIDYLSFERQHSGKSFTLTQEDVKQGFEKALDDMINSVYKSKLLTSHFCTHIAIGLMQTGMNGDIFRVSTLITKKALHIVEIIKSTNIQESGIIFVGKMLDPSKKPCLLLVNKGQQQQILVGPNKISYSEADGTFKICLSDSCLGPQMNVSNLLSQNQQNTYEILLMPSTDNSFKYGSGDDLPQNFTYNNLEQGFQELLPQSQSMQQNSSTLSSIFVARQNQVNIQHNISNPFGNSRISNVAPTHSYLARRNTINQVGHPQTVSTHIGGENGVKKTRAQILREQNAAQKQANNNNQTTPKPFLNQQQQVSQQHQNIQQQQQQQPNGGFSKWNTVNNNVKNSGFFGNNNQTPIQDTNFVVSKPGLNQNHSSTDMSFQFVNTVSSQGIPFQTQNQPNIQPQNLNNQISQPSQATTTTNTTTTSLVYNHSNPFANKIQQNQQLPIQSQQNTQSSSNNGSTHSFLNLQTNSKSLFQINQEQKEKNVVSQNQQQVILPQKMQQQTQMQPLQMLGPQGNCNSITIQNQQTRIPVVIETQKPQHHQQIQLQFQPFDSKQQQNSIQPTLTNINQQNQILHSQPTNQQQITAPLFNIQSIIQQPQPIPIQQQLQQQLTSGELSFIHGCIASLKSHVSPQQLSTIHQQLQQNPRQLLLSLVQSHQEMQYQGPTNPQSAHYQNGESQNIPQNNFGQSRIHDYDDLTLFLMTLPPLLIKNEQKYEAIMTNLEQGKISNEQVLAKMTLKTKSPTNDSFKELYQQKHGTDLIVILGKEELHCHKIVFSSCADYFKQALKRNEDLTKQEYGIEIPIKQSILIPEWMDIKAFKLLIKFIYTGKISDHNDTKKPTIDECLNLLRIANFFYIFNLQEQLIAQVIIPQLNAQSAIKLLQDCTEQNQLHYNKPVLLWEIVSEYCIFFISKHLPSFLRQDQKRLAALDCNVLYRIIERSLYYIVDGGQDLENIIGFTADMWANKDIMQVLLKCQLRFEKCTAFDCQIVPQMREFITQNVNYKTPYQCLLITGSEQNLAKGPQQSNESGLDQSSFDNHINTLAQPLKSLTDTMYQNTSAQQYSELDLANWRPANNFIKDKDGRKEVALNQNKAQKEPIFFTIINLEEQKEFVLKNQGVTIISEAFDFGRRSWHLKIDIDKENNISLWIVERGNKMHQSGKVELGQNLPITYSSMIIEFEIVDAALGDCRTTLFYSYAHDTHQIIGQKNALSISQLQNRSQLTIRVHMKDYILHSALMHYFTTNFYHIFKKEHKMLKDIQNRNANGQLPQNKAGLLTLPFYNVFQILNSNMLKVDHEDEALYFFSRYTQRFGQINPKSVQFVTNLLSSCLRFSYMSFEKELSGLRDNEYLRKSQVFIRKMREELIIRTSLTQTVVINLKKAAKPQEDQPRKFYDLQKMQQMGRRKYENMRTDKNAQVAILDELIDWAVKSHSKQRQVSQIAKEEEINKIKDQVYEEKRINSKLMSDLSILKGKYDEALLNQQRANRPQAQPNSNILKENNYIQNVSYEKVRYAKPNLDRKGAFPSPKAVPQFLNDSTTMLGDINRNNNKMVNSFSSCQGLQMSEDFHEELRNGFGANSVQQADNKVQENLHSDLSAILDKLNRNSPQRKVIEQYKSQRERGTNGQEAEQCLIF